jgi:hypothetical protein
MFFPYHIPTRLAIDNSGSSICFVSSRSSNVTENSHQKCGGKTSKNDTAPSYWSIHWMMMAWKVNVLHLYANALFMIRVTVLRRRPSLVQGTGSFCRMNVLLSLRRSYRWAKSRCNEGLDHFMVMVFTKFPNHWSLSLVWILSWSLWVRGWCRARLNHGLNLFTGHC